MAKELTIIHFNDVYNIEAGSQEPVGGAARFVHQVKAVAAQLPQPPLVLFSGDCFNPSLMSTMTLGKQMVPVLNAAGVSVAAVGNHDFDYGIDNFSEQAKSCNFPWLMANVLDVQTGDPLGGVGRTLLLQHPSGVSVGVVGLVEGDWVETLSTVEPEAVQYIDFVQEGRRLARELRAAGADIVLALTHMRVPNDLLLAQQVPEIDAVLGGHDHHVQVELLQPHKNLLCKSGTDFRSFTAIKILLPAAAGTSSQEVAAVAAAGGSSSSSTVCRLAFSWQTYFITSDVPEDPEVAEVVSEFAAVMGSKMDEVIARTLTPLDGRFTTVRNDESNLCNLFCDVFRRACSADVCILNSGTFRSDIVHPAGPLTYRDLVSILPMLDETVVLEATGRQLVQALENGVSMWPKLEGRFPQVSGIRFVFDPAQPPGSRIVPDTVTTGSEHSPLDPNKTYTLATKQYLAEGKDGYDVLQDCKVLMDAELCPEMPTVMKNYFMMLEVLNWLDPSIKVAAFAKRWSQAVKHKGRDRSTDIIVTGHCARHPDSRHYVVAPVVDGRITRLGEPDGTAQ